MKVDVKIIEMNEESIIADVAEHGGAVIKRLTFNKVKGSKGSFFSTLPSEMVKAGSALNMTLKASDCSVGATLVKDSIKRTVGKKTTSSVGGSKLQTFVVADDTNADTVLVYGVAKDGAKVRPMRITDNATLKALIAFNAFAHYQDRMVKVYEKSVAVSTDPTTVATMKALLLASGMDAKTIENVMASTNALKGEPFNLAHELSLIQAEEEALNALKAKAITAPIVDNQTESK